MSDRYTQAVLTVIAVALVLHLLRPPLPVAHAADAVRCTFAGPIEVKLTDIGDKVEVQWGFGQPGSNGSNPLYTKVVQ